MPDGSVPLLIALITLLVFSSFFSSMETAYSCASRIKLRTLSTSGNKRATKVLNLAEKNFDKLITSILVGNNIVNITMATLGTIFFGKLILSGNSEVISTAVMTAVVLVFGEITPKFITKVAPEKMAMVLYPIIKFFYYIFYVFNFIFGGWRWLLGKIFRFKDDQIVTEDEIMTVVEEAKEDGTLREDETKLIRSVIEFDDLEVGVILVPRVNVVAIDVNSSMEEIRKVFDNEGYSRIPVYKNSIDTIIGTIHQKDFYSAYLKGKKGIDGILQNAFYTTEHIKISNLLKDLQKKKVHIAIVLDEYGGTLGLVTLEDILEELVGEIWDEHDDVIDFFKKVDDNTFVVDGNAHLYEMFEFFNLAGEEEKFETNTVSGWIIEQLEEIPRVGIKFDYLNLKIEVLKATVKKVQQVKIIVEQTPEE